ncbi:hypothetical protein IWQ61_010185, partial [Dispira simplex]
SRDHILGSKINTQGLSTHYCPFHKREVTHKPEGCFRNPKNAKPDHTQTKQVQEDSKPFACFICGDPSHGANQCSKNSDNIKKEPAFQHINEASEEANKPVQKYTFPVLLNSFQTLVKLDTGAEFSCISQSLLEQFSLSMIEVEGNNTLADSTITCPHIGITSPCQLEIGKTKAIVQFEILSDINAPGILFGEDLIEIFKLDIFGLPIDFPNNDQSAKSLDFPSKPDLITDSPPFLTEIPQPIQDAIAENEAIDPCEPCPLPEAIVSIPFSQDITCNHRQYPIA